MNWNDFKKNALRTERVLLRARPINHRLILSILGLFSGSGKVLDALKRHLFYEKPLHEFRPGEEQSRLAQALAEVQEHLQMVIHQSDLSQIGQLPEPDRLPFSFRILHAVSGLGTEAGEAAERIQLILGQRRDLVWSDRVNLMEEFEDADWYKAVAFDELGLDEDDARDRLIQKLRVRFPDQYTEDRVTNRDLGQEQEALGNRSPLIYISGPMEGRDNHNQFAFDRAEKYLTGQGYQVVNPANNFEGKRDLPRSEYLREDLKNLTQCQGIYMLRGYHRSPGAQLELQVALACAIPVTFEGGC